MIWVKIFDGDDQYKMNNILYPRENERNLY